MGVVICAGHVFSFVSVGIRQKKKRETGGEGISAVVW